MEKLIRFVFGTSFFCALSLGLASCIDTSMFNNMSLIPAELTIIDGGVEKKVPVGDSSLLTKDTAIKIIGVTKPNSKVKIYTSAADPTCQLEPQDSDVIGRGDARGIDFSIDLSTLPEGRHVICMYVENPAGTTWSKLTEIIIKRSVQAFSGLHVLPAARFTERRPQFAGVAEKDTNLALYTGGSCSGTPLEYLKADSLGNFVIPLSIQNSILVDGNLTYSILATDVLGNTRCSPGLSYTLDTLISATAIHAVVPASPSNNDSPTLGGTTEENSTVELFNSSSCSGFALASDTTDSSGVFDLNLGTPLTIEDTYALTVKVTDDLGNSECFTANKQDYIYDVTPPALAIASPAANSAFKGSFTLDLTCEDAAAISASGDITSTITQSCTGGVVSVTPSLAGPDGTKSLTITATDAAGNVTTQTLNLIKDTTPPALPSITRASASPTSANFVTMTVSSCADVAQLLAKEDSAIPTGSESAWVSCTTAAGGISFDLSTAGTQGTRNIRVFVRDATGNIQPSFASVLVDYDTLPPSISLTAIPGFLGTNSYYEFKWTLTEGNVPAGANFTLEYSQNSGSSWTGLSTTPVGITGAVNSKIYKFKQYLPSTPGTTIFRVRLTDATGQTGYGSQSSILLYDITPPEITAHSFLIAGSEGPVTTYNPFVKVSFSATDNQTPVTQFCLKNSSTAPALSDTCWIAIDAPGVGVPVDLNVTLTDYDHLVDWRQGIYTVHLWIRDQAGNISNNVGPVNNGTDRIAVTYSPIPDPTLTDLIVAKNSSATVQPDPWDLVTTPGTLLYLKWKQKVYHGSAAVSLWYTINGTDFTLIEDHAENGSVLSCSAAGAVDDCTYSWSSPVPVNTTYMIQVRVTDGIGQTTTKNTVYISNPNFRPIAGNTDPGTNGSAKKAAFRGLTPDSGSFVVTRNGLLFFRDVARGLLLVDPNTGVQKIGLKLTETSSGDGGALESATSQGILKIALDFEDRVLVFEPDRIRRIDTRISPMTIESIIGAFNDGRVGENTSDYVADPHDVKIKLHPTTKMFGLGSPYLNFLALPNGDIYFQTDNLMSTRANGSRVRVYRGSAVEPYVDTLRLGGAGDYSDASTDIGAWPFGSLSFVYDPFSYIISQALVTLNHPIYGCNNFNFARVAPTTLQSLGGGHPPMTFSTCSYAYMIQGMNGQIYSLNNRNPWNFQVVKYDGSAGWNVVVGSGLRSNCPDGTPATSCAIIPNDVFVSQTGQVYFKDDGQIRIVGSDSRVYTLYGYNLSSGDGGPSMEARLNDVASIDHGTNDKVILLDTQGGRFREVNFKGTPGISTIAGNGSDSSDSTTPLGVAANVNPIGMGWSTPGRFVTNPANGDVYWYCGGSYSICRLNRASNVWQNVFTLGGTIPYETTSGYFYWDLDIPTYPLAPLAFYNNSLLVGLDSWGGTEHYRRVWREFDLTNGYSRFTLGNGNYVSSGGCNNGSSSSCIPEHYYFSFGAGPASPIHQTNIAGNNYWLFLTNSQKDVIRVGAGNITKMFSLSVKAQSIFYKSPYLYFCSVPENDSPKLYRKNFSSPYTEVELTLPHGSTCAGNKIIFKNGAGTEPDRLVFPIRQNGIYGISEFLDPENYTP
ncbi:hypothetical protein ACLWBD_07535 [Bdellovibrio sp. HCB117]|uniref:hypothetical protein n=1 Tax=Bdellovibrio sp. HCB117 TaxID=3394359 RepID=UPI0039B590A1